MRIEFLDLIESNETFASGLFTLSHLIEIAENNDEVGAVVGLAELVRLLAKASQKQTDDIKFILQMTENGK
ncbi:hypothetical protein ACWIUA_12175 [Ursidibacter sp. B-7004-1]